MDIFYKFTAGFLEKQTINMKTKNLIWILLVSVSTLCWVSCDKEEEEPLSLDQIENHSIKLYYASKGGVTIMGGDGDYSFSCNSPLLKAEMTHRNYILFETLGIGDAVVTITDQSGHSYTLNITISYVTENIVVTQLEATVIGDNMTVAGQKELKEKALATIPVKINGGYRFVYTEKEEEEETKGIVTIYPEQFGNNGIEGTFERAIIKKEDGSYNYESYTLHYKNVEQEYNRTFILMAYKPVRSEYLSAQLAEDLKDQYITDYPNVEQVYTSQVISRRSVD